MAQQGAELAERAEFGPVAGDGSRVGLEDTFEVKVKALEEFCVESRGLGRELELKWAGVWDGDLGLGNPLDRLDETDLVAWYEGGGDGEL